MELRKYCPKHKVYYYGPECPRCRNQRRVEQRIEKMRAMHNFLCVAEAKNQETKDFIKKVLSAPKVQRKLDIKENGVVFVRENGKITAVTTIGEICEKLSKEIRKE